MNELTTKRGRGLAKRIGEGERVPVAELKQFGLWDLWVEACNRALIEVPEFLEDGDNPVLATKVAIAKVRHFAANF